MGIALVGCFADDDGGDFCLVVEWLTSQGVVDVASSS
jgi:hypothetical protein